MQDWLNGDPVDIETKTSAPIGFCCLEDKFCLYLDWQRCLNVKIQFYSLQLDM